MKKGLLLASIGVFLCMSFKGQTSYTYEIGIISDNDAYLFLALDRYYTNGLMVYFSFVPKEYSDKLHNKIIEFRVGQQIYNPFQAYVPWRERVDRPFAGYLFLEAGISRFYKNESMLKTELQIGILGPSAGGEEVQTFYHRIFNLYGVEGWDYQIHDAFGMNLNLSYMKSFRYFFNRHTDLNFYSGLKAGTVNTELIAGLLTRASIYTLHPICNSSCTGSGISRDNKSSNAKELFLYFRPLLSFVIYDAAIQGGMFSDSSPITYAVMPIRLNLELGIRGSFKNLTAAYSVIYQTKGAKNNLITSHVYGSFSLGCRF
jgi:hypothetical protein